MLLHIFLVRILEKLWKNSKAIWFYQSEFFKHELFKNSYKSSQVRSKDILNHLLKSNFWFQNINFKTYHILLSQFIVNNFVVILAGDWFIWTDSAILNFYSLSKYKNNFIRVPPNCAGHERRRYIRRRHMPVKYWEVQESVLYLSSFFPFVLCVSEFQGLELWEKLLQCKLQVFFSSSIFSLFVFLVWI